MRKILYLCKPVPDSAGHAPGRKFRTQAKAINKSMAYRKIGAMQKQWTAHLVKRINIWENGGWDANEIWHDMKESMHNWPNKPTNQWINKSTHQWINGSTDKWTVESMTPWIDGYRWVNVHQCFNKPIAWVNQSGGESVNQWIDEPTNGSWIDVSMNRSIIEPMNEWTSESMNQRIHEKVNWWVDEAMKQWINDFNQWMT